MYLQVLRPFVFNIDIIVWNGPIDELSSEGVRFAGRCEAVWDDVQKRHACDLL